MLAASTVDLSVTVAQYIQQLEPIAAVAHIRIEAQQVLCKPEPLAEQVAAVAPAAEVEEVAEAVAAEEEEARVALQ